MLAVVCRFLEISEHHARWAMRPVTAGGYLPINVALRIMQTVPIVNGRQLAHFSLRASSTYSDDLPR